MKVKGFFFSLVLALGIIASVGMAQSNPVDSLLARISIEDTTQILNTSFGLIGEYPQPPIYKLWLKRIADCEGLPLPPQKELDKFRYFVVNYEGFSLSPHGPTYDGVTNPRNHTMILSLPSVWDYDVVAHEYLHFLLWYIYGDVYEKQGNIHPQKYFAHCSIRPN